MALQVTGVAGKKPIQQGGEVVGGEFLLLGIVLGFELTICLEQWLKAGCEMEKGEQEPDKLSLNGSMTSLLDHRGSGLSIQRTGSSTDFSPHQKK